ncbi:roquin-1 isoform X2 [Zerene cesonia]|uniref:roquin-1 isoform X2 n=1 Tax=Zerene cesonia TaxID=33412 RepID=UPI0018E5425C|nr:roquin-1 isoform X2 [Zerene cesonia]
MPIQAPHWTDYLNCPVCCREFGPSPRSPVSLGCGHTLCEHCLKHLHRKHCPFDQAAIQAEPEELAVNTALLQLAGYTPPPQPFHPPCIQALSETDRHAYDVIVRSLEHLAIYLKLCANNSIGNRLSRPMQRKLVTLLQCAITDEEGRGRAARAARSLGERSVTELILQHQNPQQLSANLWAAVRARGCQFLGPAMQEEVLKLVLLALEDGSALSRKVLVMFVVQRLEGDFPQASKTSIGHVVQLLYRASCFKVSKRECDSSLMQLKEEFRTYESLRREHDAQIVQIATEAGLRIAPDQWSALLYGDTAHKSHMQSIIDKLQTPQSFAQSVQELFIALQRSGDPAQLVVMSMPLDRLASIDPSPDATSPSWQTLAEIITAVKEVVSGLVNYLQQQTTGRDSNHNQKHVIQDKSDSSASQPSPQGGSTPPHKIKAAFCRDANTRSGCPRGNNCNFSHFEDDMDRYRTVQTSTTITNGNYSYITNLPPMSIPPPTMGGPVPLHIYQRFPPPPLPQHVIQHLETYNIVPTMHSMPSPMPAMQAAPMSQEMPLANQIPDVSRNDNMQPRNYTPSGMMGNQQPMGMSQGNMMIQVQDRPYYTRYGGLLTIVTEEPPANVQYRQDYLNTMYPAPSSAGAAPAYQPEPNVNVQQPVPNMFANVREPNAFSSYDDLGLGSEMMPEFRSPPGFPPMSARRRVDSWPTTSSFDYNSMTESVPQMQAPSDTAYDFNLMRDALPVIPGPADNLNNMPGDRRVVGADRYYVLLRDLVSYPEKDDTNEDEDEHELEEELMALERRIDTEFKSTD